MGPRVKREREVDRPRSDRGGLNVDAEYFRLFGEGTSGFVAYVDFFHLQDLVGGNAIKGLDDFEGNEWDFGAPPLPQSPSAYRRYLVNVAAFVSARNSRIQDWLDASDNG